MFKTAMRRFVSSVSIITASDDFKPAGMTASSVISVSMDPPTILVIINQTAGIHDVIRKRGRFCVNLLGHGHGEISRAFSGYVDRADRFQFGSWKQADDGLPVLSDASCSLICDTVVCLSYTTHSIFLGAVREIALAPSTAPLVYCEGTFWQDVAPLP
jgi:flavin reductase (DIM6/NTAB) family NADH-FMN oxidoreductase RutF